MPVGEGGCIRKEFGIGCLFYSLNGFDKDQNALEWYSESEDMLP